MWICFHQWRPGSQFNVQTNKCRIYAVILFPYFQDEETVNKLLNIHFFYKHISHAGLLWRHIVPGKQYKVINTVWYDKYSWCKVHSSNMLQKLKQVGRNVLKAPVCRHHQRNKTHCQTGQGPTLQSLLKWLGLFCTQSDLYWILSGQWTALI